MRGPAWWTLYSTGGRASMSILGGPSIIEDEEEDVEDLAPSLPNKEHFAPGVLDGIYEAPPTEILISFWGLDPVCGRIFIHINPNDTYIYKIQSFSFHEITLILENIVDKP
jgi:hypothetical protein